MDFTRLLAPVDVDTFLRDTWQRHALHIPGAPDKLAGLFDRAAFDAAIRAAPDGSGLIKAAQRAPDGTHREVPVTWRQVPDLFALGFTICVARVDSLDRAVGALAAALQRELSCSGLISVNCYHSPDRHGFGTHFDNHPVMILQIAGAKRWRFSTRPAIEWPTESLFPGTTPEGHLAPWNRPAPPDEAGFAEVTLRPGDVLYLPAGCWHQASADESSMALTVAFPHATLFELVSYALSRAALPRVGWRRDLPLARLLPDAAEAPAEAQRAIADALGELRELVAALTPAEVLRHWYRMGLSRAADRPPAGTGPAAARGLRAGDAIEIPDEVLLRFFVSEASGRRVLHVFGGASEVALAAELLPLVRGIARARRFTLRDAADWLPGAPLEGVAKVVGGLVAAGMLRPVR